jgi:phosphohistidine swiveling domain-containing protein
MPNDLKWNKDDIILVSKYLDGAMIFSCETSSRGLLMSSALLFSVASVVTLQLKLPHIIIKRQNSKKISLICHMSIFFFGEIIQTESTCA